MNQYAPNTFCCQTKVRILNTPYEVNFWVQKLSIFQEEFFSSLLSEEFFLASSSEELSLGFSEG